jgi:Icc-related predicted phosphoesterase
MRILAASDIHGKHDVYEWLVDVAAERKPDLVILAGDLLGVPDNHDSVEAAQEADRERVCHRLDRLEVPVLYITGNDDWVEIEETSPARRSLHGRRIEVGCFNFVGYQYTLPFMGGVNERAEEDIRIDLLRLEPQIDSTTVLVTHGPAYGVLDRGILDRPAGSVSLGELIDRCRPRAHIHGHIHRGFGSQGNHFNVASGGRRRAMMIDVEAMSREILNADV